MEYLGGGSALDLMKAGSLEEVGIFKLLFKNQILKFHLITRCKHLSQALIFLFATRSSRPWIFQSMNSVRSNNLSLKSLHDQGCKDTRIRKFENVAMM